MCPKNGSSLDLDPDPMDLMDLDLDLDPIHPSLTLNLSNILLKTLLLLSSTPLYQLAQSRILTLNIIPK